MSKWDRAIWNQFHWFCERGLWIEITSVAHAYDGINLGSSYHFFGHLHIITLLARLTTWSCWCWIYISNLLMRWKHLWLRKNDINRGRIWQHDFDIIFDACFLIPKFKHYWLCQTTNDWWWWIHIWASDLKWYYFARVTKIWTYLLCHLYVKFEDFLMPLTWLKSCKILFLNIYFVV